VRCCLAGASLRGQLGEALLSDGAGLQAGGSPSRGAREGRLLNAATKTGTRASRWPEHTG
jgi:hypothetical protein